MPKVFWWVVGATAVVLAFGYAHAAARVLGLPTLGGYMFDLNNEGNVPAWFSMFLLFGAAVTMLRAAYLEFGLKLRTAWGWLALGLGFIVMGIDERFGLHERLDVFEMGPGLFHYSWVLVAIPGLLVLALVFVPFLRSIPRLTAIPLLVAGGVFVLGAVVVEMVGGYLDSIEDHPALYFLEVCIEESLEMIGVLLAMRAMLLHIRRLTATPVPPAAG